MKDDTGLGSSGSNHSISGAALHVKDWGYWARGLERPIWSLGKNVVTTSLMARYLMEEEMNHVAALGEASNDLHD